MRLRLALLASLMALPACGADTPRAWDGPPAPRAGGGLEVGPFNDYLDASGDDPASPEALAARYPYQRAYLPVARLDDGTMWPTSYALAEWNGSTAAQVVALLRLAAG